MAADHGFLRVALAAVGHALALAHDDDALDDLLDHLFRQRRSACRGWLLDEGLDNVVIVVLVGDELALQRLRQFRAIAVERVRLDAEPPRQHVGFLAILDRGVVRHVDGLGNGAGNKRLGRRHHADVALH